MPRIVAGLAKGRRLATPDTGTRPTSDRAREGLFNSLATLLDLDGARVLDLFAGTGAVGLEALSRGAASSVLVDSDRTTATILRRNADAVALPGAVIRCRAVAAYLAGDPADGPFDLVFADPPYALPDADLDALLLALDDERWLAADALVVVERSARDAGPTWPPGPPGIDEIRDRRYGEGALWYGRRR